MIERSDRDVRPFGRRGAETSSAAPGSNGSTVGGDPFEIPGWEAPPKRAGPLAWAIRTAAFAGLAAVFATQYLATVGVPEGAVSRIAQARPLNAADPETTGSISHGAPAGRAAAVTPLHAAQTTRLDPCTVAGGLRP